MTYEKSIEMFKSLRVQVEFALQILYLPFCVWCYVVLSDWFQYCLYGAYIGIEITFIASCENWGGLLLVCMWPMVVMYSPMDIWIQYILIISWIQVSFVVIVFTLMILIVLRMKKDWKIIEKNLKDFTDNRDDHKVPILSGLIHRDPGHGCPTIFEEEAVVSSQSYHQFQGAQATDYVVRHPVSC